MVRYGEEAQYGDQNDEEARRQQLKSSCLPASQLAKGITNFDDTHERFIVSPHIMYCFLAGVVPYLQPSL